MSSVGEINCLAMRHVDYSDCVKSFDIVASVLTDTYKLLEKHVMLLFG